MSDSTLVEPISCLDNGGKHTAQSAGDSPNDQLTAANVATLLQQMGYPYHKIHEGEWMVDFQGKSASGLQIIIYVPIPKFMLIGVLIAQKSQMKPTAEMMMRLLRLNDLLDYVKVGFDEDGDLFVRHEINTRVLNLQELKEVVENVARAAQKVRAEIKPYLIVRQGGSLRQANSQLRD